MACIEPRQITKTEADIVAHDVSLSAAVQQGCSLERNKTETAGSMYLDFLRFVVQTRRHTT